jgi:small subunit ribosomal protein S6
MRTYEELFIVRPDASDEEIDPLVEQLTQVITADGGAVEKVEKWGVRGLAYRIAKREEGYYVLVVFNATPATVLEFERRLRVSDLVLKFLTVRIDEKLKWLEKRKKTREKRARRRPVMTPSAPSALGAIPAVPALPAAPAAPVVPAVPVAPEHVPPGAPGEAKQE